MKSQHEIKMWTPTTLLLLLFMAAGLVVIIYRLTAGLGAVTNLNDRFPWGLWIGLDVLGGVAMAAGGFLVAGAVYILNMKKYKPIARAAILNAFFGYLLAATAISLDIGVPYRIWHPIVMWQIHSIMWVVAIHVVLYTSTLATESSPMFFEKLRMEWAANVIHKILVPVVLFGVLLSLLHQSSLGAVYLIVPKKLSSFWYNSQLPTLFLASAIMMGLSMVSLETIISGKVFKHNIDIGILSGLARGTLIAAIIYLAMKLWFLAKGPGISASFNGSMEANMYLLEMSIGVIIPLFLLLMKNARENIKSIFLINILVISGVLLNRLNVAIFGLYRDASAGGASYFPTWMEFVVTLAFISFAIFGFKLSAKYLRVFPEAETQH
ncbi:MAG: NrfD/PsrC family molybdoenzyme membrane anchor subunit [Thermodesulfovibrionales bacterium]|nr:NrfD/PsrC family molybdoenzyme membrane anchor subunit [Thermodesulfovibrionales bacterium]